MITLVENNFGRRKNDNYYICKLVSVGYMMFSLEISVFFVPFSIALDTNGEILAIKE